MAFKDNPRYVGAQPQNDSWVAILEKAYVMLYGDGDFTSEEVVGGHAPAAMRAILGNKSTSPNRIYLDEAGNISEQETETVVNMPIKLSKIAPDLLQKVLIATKKANYSISVGSPSSIGDIEGLTDRHVISIDDKNYMNFKHAYSLMDATTTHVQLFNPHGKEAKTKLIYNEKLVQLMADLNKVWKDIKDTVQKNNELSATDRATLTPILEDLFATDIDSSKLKNSWQVFNNKPTFKLNLWNKIVATLEELMQDKEISKGMIKPKDEQETIKIPYKPIISYKVLQKYFDLIEITVIK